MYKRIVGTAIVTIIALCALFGASYFIGWTQVDSIEVKADGEDISLTGVRVAVGFMYITVAYFFVRFLTFIEFVFTDIGGEVSKDEREVN